MKTLMISVKHKLHFAISEEMAADRQAKAEILKLEEELPSWRTLINTGSSTGTCVELDNFIHTSAYDQLLYRGLSGHDEC